MKRTMLMTGMATAMLFAANAAEAAKVFTVTGTFSNTVGGAANAGQLSGTFTTSDNLQTLLSYSFSSTASGSYVATSYTGSNSTALFSPADLTVANGSFLKLSLGSSQTLLLNFDGPLTAAGATLIPGVLVGSSESQARVFPAFAGTRYLSGTVAAVPEPATWGMMLLGFGLVAGATRYRRKSVAVTYA